MDPSCAFAHHPALATDDKHAAKVEAATANSPKWTLDMDDMLRTAVRRSTFDFAAASRHIQGYVLRVRAAGGILPEEVVEPLYTADACRLRWTQLDLDNCRAYHDLANNKMTSNTPGAAPTKALDRSDDQPPAKVDVGPAPVPIRDGPARRPVVGGDGSGDDDDDDDDDYGIVDLNALRAQRLGGLFGAAPSVVPSSTSRPSGSKARGSEPTTRKPTSPPPNPVAQTPVDPPTALPMRGGLGGRGRDESADFSLLVGRSQQLAELEDLAAELSRTSPDSAAKALEEGASQPSGARRQAAGKLVGPLGDLKRRMEGLEALLADEATDMAAKLGEVAQVHREMAELQSLAQRAHSEAQVEENVLASADAGTPSIPAAASGGESGGFTTSAARNGGGGGLDLEAALDGLDIDGLLARLEAQNGASES